MENKNIKVLIVGSNSTVKGGITSVIDRFLNYGWKEADVELLPTYIEGNPIKKIFFYFRGMATYIKKSIKNEFDIAHVHMSYKGSFFRKYIIVKISKMFNKPVVMHLHGSEFEVFYNKSNKIIAGMIKSTLEDCDEIIVLGEHWRSVINSISEKTNIEIFNNAVNIPESKVEWNNERINILFLGVLIKRKGVYDLIEAIRELKEKCVIKERNLKFIIGGVGSEEANIKSKIKEYGLEDSVEMVGWVNGEYKECLLEKSQVFVLPSYNEGLPMAILEAMSYGMPVVSTNVGSIDEVVIDNITGYCIASGNYNELVEKIEIITADNEKWNKLSINSRKKIESNFNEENYFKEMEKKYKNIYLKSNKYK